MRLTVLGCAGSFPGPESPCSAYLVEADGFRLLIDFGSGSLSSAPAVRRAARPRRDPPDPPALRPHARRRVVRGGAPVRPGRAVPAAAGVRARRRAGPARRRVRAGGQHGRRRVPVLRASSRARFPIGPFTVTVDRVNHPVETYGVRLEHDGRVLCYSSDTAPCDSLLRLAQDADVFLCEASYLDGVDNPPDLHLTGREAGEAATKAGRRPAAAHPPGGGLGQRGAHPGVGRLRVRRAARGGPRPAPATTSDRRAGRPRAHPGTVRSRHRIRCRHGAT